MILTQSRRPKDAGNVLLAAGLVVTAGLLCQTEAQARGFGGGGLHDFGGGGFHFGGDEMAGYRGTHPMFGDGVRPAWGGDRPVNVDDQRANVIDNQRNDVIDNQRNININNNFYNRPYNGWHTNWTNGGYWNHRPWNTGWYVWAPASWGWWNGSAAAWGLAGLATGVAITSLVDNAANQQSPIILVPETEYQLNYGSVEAVGTQGASFSYSLAGGATLQGAVNCKQGLLNGQVPQTAANAQLVNAVCQVAFGSPG